jgi:hypothetical protein
MNITTVNSIINNTPIIKKAKFRLNLNKKKYVKNVRLIKKSLQNNRKITSILLQRKPIFSVLSIKKSINSIGNNNIAKRKILL